MSHNTIDWGNLVSRGRAKAFGVPWTEEENLALQQGVPASFVREGVLSVEEYQALDAKEKKQQEETGEKKVERMNKAELHQKAKELGIQFTPEVTNSALVTLIKQALEGKTSDMDEDPENKDHE